MKKLLFAALLVIACFGTTACTSNAIPVSAAEALAYQHGGTTLHKSVTSTVSGEKSYRFITCSPEEKVQIVEVSGTATVPRTMSTDLPLYCGSKSEFWQLYDEKARNNSAIKEELDKFIDLFGLKSRD